MTVALELAGSAACIRRHASPVGHLPHLPLLTISDCRQPIQTSKIRWLKSCNQLGSQVGPQPYGRPMAMAYDTKA